MNSLFDENKGTPDENSKCYLCGSQENLELHPVFDGAQQDKSKEYGLTVILCHDCRNGLTDGMNQSLKLWAQNLAMIHFRWVIDDFIRIFGKI